MKHFYALFTLSIIVLGCASEDPNIVNPPPGNAKVTIRLLNMVPDDNKRMLQLEQNQKTLEVSPGRMSATIQAPTDSSFIEILSNGTREYYSTDRYKFVRQSVYDVFAIAGHFKPEAFDTTFVSNANTSLTTLPVAQVRLVNVVPDTTKTLDVRLGCPNGPRLNNLSAWFPSATLYTDVNPGSTVFSVVENIGGVPNLIGTFECLLKEHTPYSIIAYRDKGFADTRLMLLDESDHTPNADRTFVPIVSRTAEVRVVNISNKSVSVLEKKSGQSISTSLPSSRISSYINLPTCESEQADVFEISFEGGLVVIDSTPLIVREKFTVVCADTGGIGDALLIPPAGIVFDAGGKSIVRVVNMTSSQGNVVVSAAARSDADSPTNFTSGFSLADNLTYRSISKAIAIKPGAVPITVATASKPTKFLQVSRTTLLPDQKYLFIVSEQNGEIVVNVIDDTEANTAVSKTTPAVLTRLLNGSPTDGSETSSVESVITGAQLYYRNSLTTAILPGPVSVTIAGATATAQADIDKRLLCIYAEGNNTKNIITLSTPPLVPTAGRSLRRFINATADIPLVSVAFDSVPAQTPDAEHLAREITYGTASESFLQEKVRRGSMFFYDSQQKTSLFSLPIDFGPLGNNYSLIIVGRKQSGYEVIVAQEF